MRVVVSGGGTGGHIYPALALIEQLKTRGLLDDVLYVGTHRGLESRIVPKAGIPFATIELQGFKRSLSLSNVKTVTMFLGSIGKAKRLLRDFRPDVVVGTGGYVSAATVFAATRLHIPTVIHEQNSVAGVTNKFLARFVDKIAYAFPEVADTFPAKKLVQTGNPRAQQVAHLRPNNRLADFGLTPSERTLLIFGGSRGAPKINEAAIAALPTFAASHFQTLFVTGRVHYDAVIKAAGAVPDNVKIVPYVDDMPAILPDLTLVIGRSGATSLAELTALGVPAVLIPSPNVTGNHQFINAQSLAKAGAAMVVPEDEIGADFGERVASLMQDDERLVRMTRAAKQLGVPDAADRLIAVMQAAIAMHA
ncbi:undecaprenyldiphospho-muramoylpentapeptide beta-N-acetylglucosaminyltransferase [Lacticaseibacillus nasuensis]|uniref:undecaprenyldiphospho-muramoylpentapeptide beta-N-acetylglucosaminyltransferase n=1 Tax=Lacticaseibacillus nasuensis TaxID=944671 RepID=UPI002245ADB3|nr:undecaprenyldiphospho-muramoylpentapeptide beta-N-acetylglucosaminyltransferase [Lacticaseibacillus nasuensis]MCX2454794.1 undecaprenyldiphospho-muramoylpentapeptide beta-N-acetylglucosaminyltransferase [Lacticaseibacillus nasuensis]